MMIAKSFESVCFNINVYSPQFSLIYGDFNFEHNNIICGWIEFNFRELEIKNDFQSNAYCLQFNRHVSEVQLPCIVSVFYNAVIT